MYCERRRLEGELCAVNDEDKRGANLSLGLQFLHIEFVQGILIVHEDRLSQTSSGKGQVSPGQQPKGNKTNTKRAVFQAPVCGYPLQSDWLMPNEVDLLVEPLDVFLETFEVAALLVVRGNRVPGMRGAVSAIDR